MLDVAYLMLALTQKDILTKTKFYSVLRKHTHTHTHTHTYTPSRHSFILDKAVNIRKIPWYHELKVLWTETEKKLKGKQC